MADISTFSETIGFIAGAFSTPSLVPQVYKMWKEKTGEGISMGMCLLMFIGLIFWVTYGFMTNAISLICVNSIMCVLSGMMLYFKIIYGNSTKN